MPADRLNPETGAWERAILAVLTGRRLDETARAHGLNPAELAAAAGIYHQAGRHALAQQTNTDWWHLSIEFDDWTAAEATASQLLAPVLHQAEHDGATWWFIRKHPCWRLRVRPASSNTRTSISTALDDLTTTGQLRRWTTGIYEAETAAFGGPVGIETAHALFHADSRAILTATPQSMSLGRRELSILLCTSLFRGAGLEWYEQGDVWDRVTAERPLPSDVTSDQLRPLTVDVRHLLRADLRPEGALLTRGAPVAPAADWVSVFHSAGRTLGTAAREGTLHRGLRQILAYHVLFHWNRLGLPARTQTILASAARSAVLQPE